MSVAEQVARIQADRNTIRTKLQGLGLAQATANLDELAEAIEGIVDNGSVSAQVKEGETYTIPAGYHNGSGTVSGVAGGGNYELQSKQVTPTKQQQTVTPDEGKYGLSDVVVAAIPVAYQDVSSVTVTAPDMLAGKIAVSADGRQVVGTMPDNGAFTRTLDAETPSVTVPAGRHSGAGTVSVSLEEREATPTKSEQEVVPTDGKLISKVTVAPIPAEYVTTGDATAAAADILTGKTAYVGGSKVTGSMPNNGATDLSIDGMSASSVEVPAGYTTGGTVTLTDSIEQALAAI